MDLNLTGTKTYKHIVKTQISIHTRKRNEMHEYACFSEHTTYTYIYI